MKNIFIFLLFFSLTISLSFAQITTTGTVLDNLSQEPLEGVSVYYDGTTIGVITNAEGYFSITTPKKLTTPLIISYIGYYTIMIAEPANGSIGKLVLKESAVQLNEVVLKPDTWSREKKMGIFKREFLGETPGSNNCRILNEEVIRLYYDSKAKKLHAYASKPILIVNKYLGYHLQYNLEDFVVRYHTGRYSKEKINSVYYAGTTLFSELNPELKRKHKSNRELNYYGSKLHFMRALASEKLNEENFRIFKGKKQVNPATYFLTTKISGFTKVTQIEKRLNILYKKRFNSFIVAEKSPYYIDEVGNHSPPINILFGGDMSILRVANSLPLDFNP